MRQGRSSSKHEIRGMEIEKLSNKVKEEPHLSGAYIRSLVKQLTSSKTKDSNMNPKDPTENCVVVPSQNLTKLVVEGSDETKTQTQETQQKQAPPSHHQHKKQVRRRLHTSRPYQERLLNMAEARREIVTALKFHRAAMKQATEQQQQNQPNQPPQSESQSQDSQDSQLPFQPPPLHFEQQDSGKVKSRRNHRASTTNTPNHLDNNNIHCNIPPNFPHYYPQNPLFWPHQNSTIATLPFGYVDHQSLNFTLPNQALGLNLNFQDFNNIELATPYQSTTTTTNTTNPSSFYSSTPSPSSSSSPSVAPSMAGPPAEAAAAASDGLHAAMDDEEIAEIRTLGEQHQIEWDDTVSLVTSAYWLKFLKAEDLDDHGLIGLDQCYPFDDHDHHHQVMEFPAWLSANEQHHFDDYYSSDDYFHSPSLPCMEIGEIEGMDVDGDWLA